MPKRIIIPWVLVIVIVVATSDCLLNSIFCAIVDIIEGLSTNKEVATALIIAISYLLLHLLHLLLHLLPFL